MSETREEFISNLGNPYINPQSKDLQLLFSYIKKENEVIMKFDKEDGIDVDAPDYAPDSMMMRRLSDMEDYRIAKTLLASVQKMVRDGLCSRNPVYIESLDREQRRKHNKALTSLMAMNDFAQKNNLEKIYTGKLVDSKDIRDLGSGDLEARREMTDFFLGLLTQLSKYNIQELKNEQLKKQVSTMQRKMDSTSRDYNVKKELTTYDGDIEFYDWKNCKKVL